MSVVLIQKTNLNTKSNIVLPLTVCSFPIEKNASIIELNLTLKNLSNLSLTNYIIHKAYITQRRTERQGNANSLTRGEVRGGGRKPWRQKGTGRARAGSNRSPLWRGGGVSFGPKSKVYSSKINKKEWRLALRSLLIQKSKTITILDNFEKTYESHKTNIFKQNLKKLGINLTEKILIIVSTNIDPICQVTRNIKTVKVLKANKLNLKEIIYAKKLFITKDSLKIIENTYNE
uniref:50S ribosomal protein L4 n=1 Tax=Dictyotopsis propagulifera TaxID=670095 RepID=UPI002E79F941|nr:50S ribosomal protein L4 [Dictyotopsis propagulifera]WAM63154.1 50S ribosomal protein L4 [Dictyotopsis propagulifera]